MRWWVRPWARLVSCTCSDGRPPPPLSGVVAPTIHCRLMPAGDAKMRPVAVRLYAAVSIVCVMEEEEVGGIVAAGGRQTRPLADPSRDDVERTAAATPELARICIQRSDWWLKLNNDSL